MKRNRFFSGRTLANLAVICIAVLLYMALANFSAIRDTIGWLFGIFSPFIIAIAIAYLLNMPVRFIERRVFLKRKHKRALSILTTYLLALLLLVFLIGMLLPQLIQSVVTLVRNIPAYLENLEELVQWLNNTLDLDENVLDVLMVSYTDIVNSVLTWIRDFLPNILNWTMQFGSGIVNLLTALIASIYMLSAKEKLMGQCKRVFYALLSPRRADGIMRVGALSNRVFSGFISGKILDSAIIGVICFVFMSITNAFLIEMPFALLISVIIGVTNIIPFFGPFIGAIPSVMILLLVNPWSAFWFTIFVIVLQQFDGNILGPKILGDSTGLPALWVLVAIILGGGLFGFAGMVLGVPTVAVLYTIASDIIAKRLAAKKLEGVGRLQADDAPPEEDPPKENTVPPEE